MTAVDLYAPTLVMIDPRTARTDELPAVIDEPAFSSAPVAHSGAPRTHRRPRPRRSPAPASRGRRALAAVLALAMWVIAVPLAGRLAVEAGHASAAGRPVWAAVFGGVAGAVIAVVAVERWLTGRVHARRYRT